MERAAEYGAATDRVDKALATLKSELVSIFKVMSISRIILLFARIIFLVKKIEQNPSMK